MLSREEARAFYDRFGAKQDLQRFYEDRAVEELLARSRFEKAKAVVELGCGTGRLAERLLREHLPLGATYHGFDVSGTMVRLARARLGPWSERARVEQTDGAPSIPRPNESCDRFLSTYVLDLLPEEDIRAALAEAGRLLVPGGLLCLAGLTFGETALSRAVCGLWSRVQAWRPALVGGCRPLRLLEFLGSDWRVDHRRVICSFGVCSEVVVAEGRSLAA
jgi:ubiquinone/menaquinone biosynthesis C-methylase UbiE